MNLIRSFCISLKYEKWVEFILFQGSLKKKGNDICNALLEQSQETFLENSLIQKFSKLLLISQFSNY